MQLKEEHVEPMLESQMSYEPGSITVESFVEDGPGRYVVEIDVSEAPRDESEFFVNANRDYRISFATDYTENDNAPSDDVVRMGLNILREDLEEIEALEGQILPDEITIIVSGYLSLPDYCDDETDGNLNATAWIEVGGRGWAEQESLLFAQRRAEESLERHLQAITTRMRSLREMGNTNPIAMSKVKDLVRVAFSGRSTNKQAA